ncbi:MAG: DUF2207 domain-containing protein [Clostridia bacterium]|nr:DUF2207 domain-containing protein [Clostridia bacterium]
MNLTAILTSSILIAAGFLTTVIPLIYGAVKKRKVLKPVEYLPPRGASPLDIMIQYFGASAEPREIFNPLMLYWAERGFITVEEDCRRGLKLTKLKDLTPPDGDGYDYKTFKIEKQLFDNLFGGSKKVFYTLAALSGFKNYYNKIIAAANAEAKKVTAQKSGRLKFLSLAVSFATLVGVILTVGLAAQNNVVIACIFTFVAIAFPKGVLAIPVDANHDGIPKGSAARFLMVPFFLMFGGLPFMLVVSVLPFSASVILGVAFVCCALNVFILCDRIDVRSNEQLKFYGAICGFKNFLLLAEVKQLNALVEENPRYFYSVLPYCYVLKITKKLKPKFDAIALDGPAWYLGELRETLMF